MRVLRGLFVQLVQRLGGWSVCCRVSSIINIAFQTLESPLNVLTVEEIKEI